MNRKEHMQNSRKFYTMAGNYYFLLCISANISSHEVQCKAYFLDTSNVSLHQHWGSGLFLGALDRDAFHLWKRLHIKAFSFYLRKFLLHHIHILVHKPSLL